MKIKFCDGAQSKAINFVSFTRLFFFKRVCIQLLTEKYEEREWMREIEKKREYNAEVTSYFSFLKWNGKNATVFESIYWNGHFTKICYSNTCIAPILCSPQGKTWVLAREGDAERNGISLNFIFLSLFKIIKQKNELKTFRQWGSTTGPLKMIISVFCLFCVYVCVCSIVWQFREMIRHFPGFLLGE